MLSAICGGYQASRGLTSAVSAPQPGRLQDKNLHFFGRAALLRRPKLQGRAAALPYQEGEDSCHAPSHATATTTTQPEFSTPPPRLAGFGFPLKAKKGISTQSRQDAKTPRRKKLFAVLFPRTVHFRQSFSVSVFSVCSCSNSLVVAQAAPSLCTLAVQTTRIPHFWQNSPFSVFSVCSCSKDLHLRQSASICGQFWIRLRLAALRLCVKNRRVLRAFAAKERKEHRDKNLCCFFFAIFAVSCGNSASVAARRAAFSTELFRLCFLSLLLFRFFGCERPRCTAIRQSRSVSRRFLPRMDTDGHGWKGALDPCLSA